MKTCVRAKVEHPGWVITHRLACNSLRYKGLAKNTAHWVTLFGLGNLWMARRCAPQGAQG